ncbi:DUF202 domain-containing protein [Croceibacter atlanticus]|jgi:putative membrane protein|uniref:DUF202 domain-containing protein n=1 Tax=Croceibacter atlanticus TaxID=313588 RepID=UPI0024BB2344|nr:DUF202 domain-containing protein [Croceibacter atlanticus]|tara:strand:- start:217 stop:567 length:351 start_codon:yes stop_codon:yes gene_type:complete
MKLKNPFRTSPVPANTREILALERTRLANERTLMAYIRSSLYLLIGGIAVLQLKDYSTLHSVGYLALVSCVIFLTIGISRFLLLKRKLFKWKKILGEELLEESLNEKEHPKEISEE